MDIYYLVEYFHVNSLALITILKLVVLYWKSIQLSLKYAI